MSWISTQRERLQWRVEFLADRRAFPLRERLAYVNPLGRKIELDELLFGRLRRTPDGQEYFDMNGRKIFFRPDWPIEDEAELYRGIQLILYEAFVNRSEFFCDEVSIRPGDVVFDVGGNLGTSAMLFAELAGPSGRVFSFEPVFHGLLETNLRANGVRNVEVVPKGVASACGSEEFAITSRGIDSRADPIGSGGIRKQVEMITLDAFVEQEGLRRVDFIKMDIEGAEESALRGADRVIREFRPRWSIASYHNDCGFNGGEAQHPKLVALLRQHGYQLREIGQRHIFAW